jgi:superfamily II DNA helicase RecQ
MQALRNFPHIKSFKNNQKAIINCALTKKDVFVCMPTGGGKSLTFQILTFIKKGIYICILPLVSLIFDQ